MMLTAPNKNFIVGCLCGSIGTIGIVLGSQALRHWWFLLSTEEEDVDGHASFVATGKSIMDWIVTYRSTSVNLRPVISTANPNYLCKYVPPLAPSQSESWGNIMIDLNRAILPGLTNWECSSKFFAYFKPHASYPAVLGELLCAGLNVMGFDWIASPACTELEVIVLDWLARFLDLPHKFFNLREGPGELTWFKITFRGCFIK